MEHPGKHRVRSGPLNTARDTLVSVVTVVDSRKLESMETVTAIQVETLPCHVAKYTCPITGAKGDVLQAARENKGITHRRKCDCSSTIKCNLILQVSLYSHINLILYTALSNYFKIREIHFLQLITGSNFRVDGWLCHCTKLHLVHGNVQLCQCWFKPTNNNQIN